MITGEGRLDPQTLHGKLIYEIVRRAGAAHVPVHAVVGQDVLSSRGRRTLGLRSVSVASTIAEMEAAGEAIGRGLL